jgi:signal peptidase I
VSWAIVAATLVACAVALVLVRRRFVAVLIEGDSMEPTLRAGQRVLVRRVGPGRVRLGDVVVLANPNDLALELGSPAWLIKRVAAVPGDPVPRETVPALRNVTEALVPAGRLVLLGDNPAAGYDSRRTGYFTSDALLGVVARTLRS